MLRKVLCVLVFTIAMAATACRGGGGQGDTDVGSSAVIQGVATYKAEPLMLETLNNAPVYNTGVALFINGNVCVPVIMETYRWRDEVAVDPGERNIPGMFPVGNVKELLEIASPDGEGTLRVGRDVIYGEDFYTVPIFHLSSYTLDDERGTVSTHHVFENDVIHVNLLTVDILSLDEPGGILLLANQFKENGESSTVLVSLSNMRREASELIIEQELLGGENKRAINAWFDTDRNIFIQTWDSASHTGQLVVLDPTATNRLAQIETSFDLALARGNDGKIWSLETVRAAQQEPVTALQLLNKETWTWEDETILPIDFAIGLYAAPGDFEFEWVIPTELELYGVTKNGEVVRYITWLDIDVHIKRDTEFLFPGDGQILLLTPERAMWQDNAIVIETTLLSRTDVAAAVGEREELTVGGVNIQSDLALHHYIRQFNRASNTHRAVIFDYAEHGEWDGVAMRMRADLIAGRGPDVMIFNQWGDENDITSAMMRGGFLTDLNVFLENDPVISREDFFENILDIWTNEAGELLLATGAVVPMPFWGPSEKLDSFTDFTHKGFLEFLRKAEAEGVKYPAGVNFLPYVVFQTMLFADDTFFCYETGKVNFDSDLFIDILNYAGSIPDEQQATWIRMIQETDGTNPIPFFSRGEQLMTNMSTVSMMNVFLFRMADASVGGLTPIGAPNAAGELAIAAMPIVRMGIRANSDNKDAAWDFIRLYLQEPNTGGSIDGFPILRSLFEADINASLLGSSDDDGTGFPRFTEEKAAVLRQIIESITHEYHPDPYIMAIILENTAPFFAGGRTAEEAARIIQSRVSRYLSEMN